MTRPCARFFADRIFAPVNLTNFDQQLDKKLLKKGLDYHQGGAVVSLEEHTPGAWFAVVSGNDEYEVEIHLDGRRNLLGHVCDCPVDDDFCKHQVAVLYRLREDLASGGKTGAKTAKRDASAVDDLLAHVPPDALKRFVRDHARKDREFRQLLLVAFAEFDPSAGAEQFASFIRDTFRRVGGREKFVDYGRVREFVKPVEALLAQGERQLGEGNVRRAFEVARAVLDELPPLYNDVDDSAGKVAGCVDRGFDLLRATWDAARAPAFRDELFDYLLRLGPSDALGQSGYETAVFQLLDAWSDSPARERAYLALLDRMQEQARRPGASGVTQRGPIFFLNTASDRNFEEEQALHRKMAFFTTRNRAAEAQALLEANLHLRELFLRHVRALLAEDRLAEAKKLLATKISTLLPESVKPQDLEWYELRADLARREGDRPTERLCLLALWRSSGFSPKLFQQLKRTYPAAEWPAEADARIAELWERTVANPSRGSGWGLFFPEPLADTLATEQRGDQLFELLKKFSSLDRLLRYDRHVPPARGRELLDLYLTALFLHAEQEVNRAGYQALAKALERMKTLPGGPELVAETLADFRNRYARRRTMWEEFRGL